MTDTFVSSSVHAPDPATPAPRRTWRWLVALMTTAVMLAGTMGVAVFAQNGVAGAGGPNFLPSGSLAYVEGRLDLPGDQRDRLLAFLAHFPGFADGSTFDTKIEEALDQALGSGTQNLLLYTRDVKPWFDGRIVLGLQSIPAELGTTGSMPLVVGLGVKDRPALETMVATLLAGAGAETTTEDYNGTTLTTVTSGSGTPPTFAITDGYLLLSPDAATLKTSLDVLSGSAPSLAADAAYVRATSTLPADNLASFYVDTAQLRSTLAALIEREVSGNAAMSGMEDQIATLVAALPDTLAGALRVDADHLTADFEAVPGPATPVLSVRATELAGRMPADSLLYIETRDLGVTIGKIVAALKPAIDEQVSEDDLAAIERELGATLETYLDFVEDAAIGFSAGESGISLGIAASLSDEAAAQQRITRLLTLLRTIIVTTGVDGIRVTDADVDGVTVTTIAIDPDVADLPPNLPFQPSVSLAVADGQLLLGLGDFASQALLRDPADSLAADARFLAASTAAGSPNAGLIWVDLVGTVTLIESMMSPTAKADFETNGKPFLQALDHFVSATTQTDGVISSRSMLFVK